MDYTIMLSDETVKVEDNLETVRESEDGNVQESGILFLQNCGEGTFVLDYGNGEEGALQKRRGTEQPRGSVPKKRKLGANTNAEASQPGIMEAFWEKEDSYFVTVEESMNCPEEGTSFINHVKVNLLSHCVFCLRKTTKSGETSTSGGGAGADSTEDEHLQVVPRGEFSHLSSLPFLMSTFNHTWCYLQTRNGDSATQEDPLSFLKSNENNTLTFSSLPVMCKSCAENIREIDRLAKELNSQLDMLGKVIKESNCRGKYSWRAENFRRALRSSELNKEIIEATIKILGKLGMNETQNDPRCADAEQSEGNVFSHLHPEPASTGLSLQIGPVEAPVEWIVTAPEINSSTPQLFYAQDEDEDEMESQLGLGSSEKYSDSLDFIDENDEWSDSDPDYIKSEDEEDSTDDQESSVDGDISDAAESTSQQFTYTPQGRRNGKKMVPASSKINKKGADLSNEKLNPVAVEHMKITNADTHSEEKKFKCGFSNCGEAFATYKALEEHKMEKHNARYKAYGCEKLINPTKKTFACGVWECGQVYSTWIELHEHRVEKHDPNYKPLPCNKCEKSFPTISSLRRHKLHVHPSAIGTTQTCDLCKCKIPTVHIYEHVREHVGEEYLLKCPNPQCTHVYSNTNSLHWHLKIGSKPCKEFIASTEEFLKAINTCQECGHQAYNSQTLRSHLLYSHENPTKNFSCPICPLKFTVRQSVAVHIPKHDLRRVFHNQKCSDCSVNIKLSDMANHLKEVHQTQEVIQCNRCPFLFSTRERLVDHLYVHRYGELACDICGDHVKFQRHFRVSEHYFKEHQVGQHHTCEHCEYVTYSRRQWAAHAKKHVGEGNVLLKTIPPKKVKQVEKHKCDICDAVYGSAFAVRDHKIREHKAEPYSCKICSQICHTHALLLRHEREHKEGTVMKNNFKCEVDGCAKSYKRNSHLLSHICSAHQGIKPHVCELCGKGYTGAHGLRTHNATFHLGLRNHICDTCGESFTEGGSLKRHKLIHTGERPFGCDICGQRFRHKEVLKTHIEGHRKKGADFKPNGPMKKVRKRVAVKVKSLS